VRSQAAAAVDRLQPRPTGAFAFCCYRPVHSARDSPVGIWQRRPMIGGAEGRFGPRAISRLMPIHRHDAKRSSSKTQRRSVARARRACVDCVSK